MAYVRFNDGVQCDVGGWPRGITGSPPTAPGSPTTVQRLGSRFAGWTPFDLPRQDVAETMATAALIVFDRANEIPGATFRIPMIRADATGQDSCQRLLRHLRRGGTVAVNTEDRSDRSYATCGLTPGSQPSLVRSDDGHFYELALSLVNLAASPPRLLCDYT